jgi:hypothetical protein
MQLLGSYYDALQYDAAFFNRQLPKFQRNLRLYETVRMVVEVYPGTTL